MKNIPFDFRLSCFYSYIIFVHIKPFHFYARWQNDREFEQWFLHKNKLNKEITYFLNRSYFLSILTLSLVSVYISPSLYLAFVIAYLLCGTQVMCFGKKILVIIARYIWNDPMDFTILSRTYTLCLLNMAHTTHVPHHWKQAQIK